MLLGSAVSASDAAAWNHVGGIMGQPSCTALVRFAVVQVCLYGAMNMK